MNVTLALFDASNVTVPPIDVKTGTDSDPDYSLTQFSSFDLNQGV